MKKGIIMEMDDAFLTLLTPEGEFLRAERTNHAFNLGEEIHFFPIETPKSSSNKLKKIVKIRPLWFVSAAAAFILVLSSLIPIYQGNKAYAYMSIDVNPSIELGVNKHMQVVEIKGFNKDGQKIVSELHDWKKRDVSDLTETILTEMRKDGYLDHNEPVIISTVHSEKPSEQVEKKLSQNIKEIKQTASKQKLSVTVYSSSKDDLEKAHKLGITTGQYRKQEQESTLSKKEIDKSMLKSEDSRDEKPKPGQNHTVVTPSQKEQAKPPKKKDSFTPPGQQKKQADQNSAVQKSDEKKSVEKKPQSNQGKFSNDKNTQPGQQKKSGEKQVEKNNNGKEKKQSQGKKQEKQNSKSNGNKESNHKEKQHK